MCPLCVWNINLAFKFVTDCKRSQKWFKESLSEKEEDIGDVDSFPRAANIPEITMGSQEIIQSSKEETLPGNSKEKEIEFTNSEEVNEFPGGGIPSPMSIHSFGSDNAEAPDIPLEVAPVAKKKGPKRRKRVPNGEYICEPCGK